MPPWTLPSWGGPRQTCPCWMCMRGVTLKGSVRNRGTGPAAATGAVVTSEPDAITTTDTSAARSLGVRGKAISERRRRRRAALGPATPPYDPVDAAAGYDRPAIRAADPPGGTPRYDAPMTDRVTLPYGSWPSPISLDLVVAGGRAVFEPRLDGEDVYVLESRPDEGGRQTLLRLGTDGSVTELTPGPANVRDRVHEMGGGAWTVDAGLVVRSQFPDDSLWRIDPDGSTRGLVSI